MESLDSFLAGRLAELEATHLRRRLRPLNSAAATRIHPLDHPRPLLNFSSNDYLGLAQHPAVRGAAIQAASAFGAGSTASRLVCGSLLPHHDLERDLAAFKRLPAALAFSSGYAAALGTIPALVGPGDVVVLDRLAHASLLDGARLSGARLRVFRHNDVDDLERILRWVARQPAPPPGRAPVRTLVVTESVFSMDGDTAPLRDLVACKDRHGAWLMVDEAHATGVLGPEGRGWIEELGLRREVEVTLGTLGKALGAAGGFVAGSVPLCEYLLHRARSFLFSTAPAPATVGAARAALGLLSTSEGADLRRALGDRIRELHAGLLALGCNLPPPAAAILPLVVGDEAEALRLAQSLSDLDVYVPAIRFPTVARGKARLRLTVSAAHSAADIQALLHALRQALHQTGIRTGHPQPPERKTMADQP
jgi:8-amino-7-oxononanoate synthase